MKRLAVVLAVAAIGLMASPAAADYPPGDDGITVSDATPCPGQKFTITAGDFQPGTTVTVTLLPSSVLGTPEVGDDGSVTLDVTLSATQAVGKPATIEVAGAPEDESEEGDVLILSADVDVVACDEAPPTTAPPTTAAPGGSLPKTGDDSTMPLLKIGGGMAAAGGVLLALAATRRRRHGAPAA
jgi:LPXTG-motif cell wall-anchored protein